MGHHTDQKPNCETTPFALGITFNGLHKAKRIQKLHPKIFKIKILAKTYCEVYFKSEPDQTEALAHFQTLVASNQVREVKIIDVDQAITKVADVNNFKAALNQLIGNIEKVTHSNPKHQVTDGIFIRDLPRDITKEEVIAQFPDALDVTILVPNQHTKGAGVAITMPSPGDALKARKGKRVTLRGVSYRPEFQRDGKMTVRQAKRLSFRGTFVEAPKQRAIQAPRYFMTPGVKIKEEKLDQNAVESYLKIYN